MSKHFVETYLKNIQFGYQKKCYGFALESCSSREDYIFKSLSILADAFFK